MNKFNLFLLGLLALVGSAFGQTTTVTAVTGGTPVNVLAFPAVITEIRFSNANTTNNAVLKFYDNSTSATNVVREGFYTPLSYTTNFTTVSTNFGVVFTNTYEARVTTQVFNAGVTNERSRVIEWMVPPSTTDTIITRRVVGRGWTLLSTTSGTLTTTYRAN